MIRGWKECWERALRVAAYIALSSAIAISPATAQTRDAEWVGPYRVTGIQCPEARRESDGACQIDVLPSYGVCPDGAPLVFLPSTFDDPAVSLAQLRFAAAEQLPVRVRKTGCAPIPSGPPKPLFDRVDIGNGAQSARLVIDRVTTESPTDSSLNNDRDETYFIVTAVRPEAGAVTTAVRPVAELNFGEDYYQMPANAVHRKVLLWHDRIPVGSVAIVSVAVAEQDNAQFDAIVNVAEGTGRILLDLVLSQANAEIGSQKIDAELVKKLGELAVKTTKDLIQSLSESGDQTIGSFHLIVTNNGTGLQPTWKSGSATVASEIPNTLGEVEGAALLRMSGAGASYALNAHVYTEPPMLAANVSGKCLDVPSSLTDDGVRVQQSRCHGKPNQRFVLEALPPADETDNLFAQAYRIVASHSDKCLEIGGLINSGSERPERVVQQASCRPTGNESRRQRWLASTPDPQGRIYLRNNASPACLTVGDGSQANGAQIKTTYCDFNAAQAWQVIDNIRDLRWIGGSDVAPFARLPNDHRWLERTEDNCGRTALAFNARRLAKGDSSYFPVKSHDIRWRCGLLSPTRERTLCPAGTEWVKVERRGEGREFVTRCYALSN